MAPRCKQNMSMEQINTQKMSHNGVNKRIDSVNNVQKMNPSENHEINQQRPHHSILHEIQRNIPKEVNNVTKNTQKEWSKGIIKFEGNKM